MKNSRSLSSIDRMLGSCGLLLIGLFGWACDQRTEGPPTLRRLVRSALALVVIESVAALGWLIDHVAPLGAVHATREFTRVER